MLEWHPISTVPRDWTPVLVWMPEPHLNSHYAVALYKERGSAVVGGCFDFDLPSKPTHWAAITNDPATVTHSEEG